MFLIEKFRQFHGELLGLTKQVEVGNWVFDAPVPAGESGADAAPSAVWRRLLSLLERQSLEAVHDGGGFAAEVYRGAQYAMAAYADEVFLNLQWAGRDTWRDHLLESRLFGTHRAGDELFERIETLLGNRDTAYSELARVYLIVLALGFQGKFRGLSDAEQQIEPYRHRLFRFIFKREPLAVRGAEEVMPQAYATTLNESRSSQLPYLRPWLWAAAVVVLLWVAGAHWIWDDATSRLETLVGASVDPHSGSIR
jgi:type VI secretion system protein ImpK